MQGYDLPLEELERYKPALTALPDFEQFWRDQRRLCVGQPLHTAFDVADPPGGRHHLWKVTWDGFQNGRIGGRLWLPAGRSDKPFPLVVLLHGYGWYPSSLREIWAWVAQGMGVFAVNIRGQDVESPDPNVYPDVPGRGWLIKGALSRDTCYYRYVYLDCLRALAAIREHPQVDDSRIGVMGLSQGGGLALVLAALDRRLAFCVAGAPFMAHIRRAVELYLDPPYDEISRYFQIQDPLHRTEATLYESLSYYDVMNHVPSITAPTAIGIGLDDRICPPSTGFACVNHLTAPRTTWVYPESGHDLPPDFYDRAMLWVIEALNRD